MDISILLSNLFNLDAFKVVAFDSVLVLIDAALGILIALRDGTFKLEQLPEFLRKNVLPYVGSLVLMALAAKNEEAMAALLLGAGAFAVKFLWVDLKDKFLNLLGLTPGDVEAQPHG